MPSLATQRLMVRQISAWPTPMLRLMAGGGVVYQGGRTLDPRLQYLAAQSRNGPPIAAQSPQDVRAGSSAALASLTADPDPGVRIEALTIEGPGGAVPARIYRPDGQDPETPLLVFAHMGGGVIGDLATCQPASILARVTHGPVISVDLPPGPRAPFPGGVGRRAAPIAGMATTPSGLARRSPRRPSAAIPWAAISAAVACQEPAPGRAATGPAAAHLPLRGRRLRERVDDHLRRRLPAQPGDDGLVHGPLHGPRRQPRRPSPVAARAGTLAGLRRPWWSPPASIPCSTKARPTPDG